MITTEINKEELFSKVKTLFSDFVKKHNASYLKSRFIVWMHYIPNGSDNDTFSESDYSNMKCFIFNLSISLDTLDTSNKSNKENWGFGLLCNTTHEANFDEWFKNSKVLGRLLYTILDENYESNLRSEDGSMLIELMSIFDEAYSIVAIMNPNNHKHNNEIVLV